MTTMTTMMTSTTTTTTNWLFRLTEAESELGLDSDSGLLKLVFPWTLKLKSEPEQM
jgi:hypothetical protein